MHLAQVNIARTRYPLDDARLADFVNNLDRVNGVAERSPGFVWRLKDESGSAVEIKAFDDSLIIVNLSVWESAEALESFVWKTVHKRVYQRKGEWFDALKAPHFAMWWVANGYRPTVEEARERLDLLALKGPSEGAFGWESLPNIRLWMSQRCA